LIISIQFFDFLILFRRYVCEIFPSTLYPSKFIILIFQIIENVRCASHLLTSRRFSDISPKNISGIVFYIKIMSFCLNFSAMKKKTKILTDSIACASTSLHTL